MLWSKKSSNSGKVESGSSLWSVGLAASPTAAPWESSLLEVHAFLVFVLFCVFSPALLYHVPRKDRSRAPLKAWEGEGISFRVLVVGRWSRSSLGKLEEIVEFGERRVGLTECVGSVETVVGLLGHWDSRS